MAEYIIDLNKWPRLPEEIEVARRLLAGLKEESPIKELLRIRLEELDNERDDQPSA